MSRFSGPQGAGAQGRHRLMARAEAEARTLATPPERRRAVRLHGCVTRKTRYVSERDAQVALASTVVARNVGSSRRHECRWYECPLCGGWHLTSSPARAEGASS